MTGEYGLHLSGRFDIVPKHLRAPVITEGGVAWREVWHKERGGMKGGGVA